jgi:hypothetical protein
MHKEFKCLDISTGHVYISWDAIFGENIFPFANLHANAEARLHSEILLLPSALQNPDTSVPGGELTNDQVANISNHVLSDLCPGPAQNSTENEHEIPSGGGHATDAIPEADSSARTQIKVAGAPGSACRDSEAGDSPPFVEQPSVDSGMATVSGRRSGSSTAQHNQADQNQSYGTQNQNPARQRPYHKAASGLPRLTRWYRTLWLFHIYW